MRLIDLALFVAEHDDHHLAAITALPLYHIFALTANSLTMIKLGAHNILIPPPEVCERAAAQWNALEEGGKLTEWPAMLRWMDQIDVGYRA